MEAGRLRHVADIDYPTATQDASGDPVITWTRIGSIRCEIAPGRGREAAFFGNQLLSEMDTVILTRWSPMSAQITGAHRLRHQGTIFNVVSNAHILLMQRDLYIGCKSGVNNG